MSSQPSPEDIENLVELFNQSDWEEMHLKSGPFEIFLSNDPKARPPGETVAAPAPAAVATATDVSAAGPAPTAAAAPTASASAAVTVPDGMVAVRAPNLGTFYESPKPGAPPYVTVGQTVDADSEVCLIEVMKLFTPVKAGIAGKVHEICVADATMVEFEQVLVIIDPS